MFKNLAADVELVEQNSGSLLLFDAVNGGKVIIPFKQASNNF